MAARARASFLPPARLKGRLHVLLAIFLAAGAIGSPMNDYDVSIRILYRYRLTTAIINRLPFKSRPFFFQLGVGGINIIHSERDVTASFHLSRSNQ